MVGRENGNGAGRRSIAKAWDETFRCAYIINMSRRGDRRRECEAELARVGLAPDGDRITFFPAVEPEDPTPFASRGEKGCFLSHLAILERIESEADGIHLILEDDFCFFRHFLRDGAELLNALRGEGWDLAQLGALLYETDRRFRKDPLWSAHRRWGFGTHCYAVRPAGAAKARAFLASHLLDPDGHLAIDLCFDKLLAEREDVRLLTARRPFAFQRPSKSDLRVERSRGLLPKMLGPTAAVLFREYIRLRLP